MANDEVPGDQTQGPLDQGDREAPPHYVDTPEVPLIPFQAPPLG
jgi:hypothetical protein